MKKKILMVFAILLATATTHSQDNCNHNVSTNYKNPTNNSLPPTQSGVNTKFLNRFNWNATDSFGSWAGYQLQGMFYNQLMANVYNSQQSEYYSYVYAGEEMTYENGWELLLLNIGRFPDNVTPVEPDISDLPYIILYNRYRGIIRMFVNYGVGPLSKNYAVNAIRIELRYETNMHGQFVTSGLLRLNAGRDQALDQKTNLAVVSSLAEHPSQAGRWFSTDFQVAYDPCICYYPSNLRINFFIVDNVNFELHGRELTVEQDMIEGAVVNSKDFLSNFNYTGGIASGGMVLYHALTYLANDYQHKLEQHRLDLAKLGGLNVQLERNLAIIKAFKGTTISDSSAAIASVSKKAWFGDLVKYAPNLVGKDSLRTDLLLREAKKAIAEGTDIFVAGNFQTTLPPNKWTMASTAYTDMYFTGELYPIILSGGLSGTYFYTPGTYGSAGTGKPYLSSFSEYPIYNESLGLFALLETPRFIVSKTSSERLKTQNWKALNVVSPGHSQEEAYLYESWSTNYQFQLAEPLKYYFNNALDIHSTKINASISFQSKINYNKGESQLMMGYIDPSNSANISGIELQANKSEINPTQYSKLLALHDYDEGEFYKGKSISELIDEEWPVNYIGQEITVNTPFLDVNALKGHTFSFGFMNEAIKRDAAIYGIPPYSSDLKNSGLGIDAYKFVLTLVIDVEFNSLNSNGKHNSTTLILKYYINNPSFIQTKTSDLFPNLSTSNNNLTRYPENILLKDVVFNGSPVAGCTLNNTTYTCQAWNDITINGNLSTSNGYSAKLIAGNRIDTLAQSVIGSGVYSAIVPLLNYSNPMPAATPSYVASFCKDKNRYHASVVKNTPAESVPDEHFDFNLFPNPSSNVTTVAISGADAVYASIQVFDVMGKEQALAIEQEGGVFRFNVSTLDKGIYFVKVSSANGAKTKQLLVK